MGKFYFLAMICLSVFALTNCGKELTKTTDLRVVVLANSEGLNIKHSDVEVSVFKSLEDLKAQKNKVATQKTNKEGVAEFKNLAEGIYYVLAENSTCLTNYSSIAEGKENYFKVDVKENYTPSQIVIPIEQINVVDFNNYLGKDIYISVGSVKKRLLKNNGTLSVILTSITASLAFYPVSLYNNPNDAEPFKTFTFNTKESCDVLPVDIRD